MTRIDTGNNSSYTIGIDANEHGYTAMTGTASRDFKTYSGARRWLARRGYTADGQRIN